MSPQWRTSPNGINWRSLDDKARANLTRLATEKGRAKHPDAPVRMIERKVAA